MAAGGFFLRFLASGALFLAGTTTLQSADAASSTDEAARCTAESTACIENDVCLSCITDYDTTEYEECVTATLDATSFFSSGSASCFSLNAIISCCVDEASEESCVGNDQFVEYWQCLTVLPGCPTSELPCHSEGGSDSSDSNDSSSNSSNSRAPSIRKLSSAAFPCILALAAALGLMIT